MKKEELRKILEEMKVPAHLYNLDGKGRDDERLCLRCNNEEWEIYYSERGVKTTCLKFASEDEACQHLYTMLKPRHRFC